MPGHTSNAEQIQTTHAAPLSPMWFVLRACADRSQVGNDASASRWLGELEDPQRLDCQFDIVDTITSAQLARAGLPFAQWVARSVMPELLTTQHSVQQQQHRQHQHQHQQRRPTRR